MHNRELDGSPDIYIELISMAPLAIGTIGNIRTN